MSSPEAESRQIMEIAAAVIGTLLGAILGLLAAPLQTLATTKLLGPKLSLEPQELPTKEHNLETGQERAIWFARVKVRNDKPKTAQGCRAYLTGIEKWNPMRHRFEPTDFRDTFQLIWSYDRAADGIAIPYGVMRTVDVLRSDTSTFHVEARASDGEYIDSFFNQWLYQQKGRFRFQVVVAADDIARSEVPMTVEFGETWPPKLLKSIE